MISKTPKTSKTAYSAQRSRLHFPLVRGPESPRNPRLISQDHGTGAKRLGFCWPAATSIGQRPPGQIGHGRPKMSRARRFLAAHRIASRRPSTSLYGALAMPETCDGGAKPPCSDGAATKTTGKRQMPRLAAVNVDNVSVQCWAWRFSASTRDKISPRLQRPQKGEHQRYLSSRLLAWTSSLLVRLFSFLSFSCRVLSFLSLLSFLVSSSVPFHLRLLHILLSSARMAFQLARDAVLDLVIACAFALT